MWRWVCRFSVLLALVALLGCGSSGGGGAGTGDPIEVEVGDTIDALVIDLQSLDAQKVKTDWLDSNMQYHRLNLDVPGNVDNFKTRLDDFFAKIEPQSLTFAINNRGIQSAGDNGAQMLADLVVTYTPKNTNNPVTLPSEKLNLVFEKVGKWGVISFGSPLYQTSFPPQL